MIVDGSGTDLYFFTTRAVLETVGGGLLSFSDGDGSISFIVLVLPSLLVFGHSISSLDLLQIGTIPHTIRVCLFDVLPVTCQEALAVFFSVLVSTLQDIVGLIVVGHFGFAVFLPVLERSLIQVFIGLQHSLAVFLPLIESTLVVLPVLLFQSALPVIHVICHSSNIHCSVGLGDSAFDIMLHIIQKCTLIDISVLVPEHSLPILLPVPELSQVRVSILVGNLPLPIKEPTPEGALILEHLLSAIQLGNYSPSIILPIPELPAVAGAILLEQIPSPIELVIPEVPVITTPVGEFQVALARPAPMLHRTLIRRTIRRGNGPVDEHASPEQPTPLLSLPRQHSLPMVPEFAHLSLVTLSILLLH